MRNPRVVVAILFGLTGAVLPVQAQAATIQWSTHLPVVLADKVNSYTGGWQWWFDNIDRWEFTQINNGQATVMYGASITNMDTGQNIPCDVEHPAAVPRGTHLKFEFAPHTFDDVFWFTSGGTFDSPYGDWVANASRPYAAMCSNIADKDYIATYTNKVAGSGIHVTGETYISFSVAPPEKNITGQGSLICGALTGGVQECIADAATSVTPTFQFAATNARFYARLYVPIHPVTGAAACYTSNQPMERRDVMPTNNDYAFYGPFTLSIPAQTISCPLTVTDTGTPAGSGSTPTTPALSAAGASSCTTGISHAVTMSATSPDSHPLRYLIDWDADGMTDELIPASGYVPSGTVQSSSRTYATAGQKTIKVRAQDDRGLLSPWATLSFACAAPAVTTDTDTTPDPLDGTVGTVDTSSSPDLQLRATPSLVKKGDTTRLNWSATNVSACTVSGTNGDLWDTISSLVGGNLSGAITQQTIFTLSCVSTSGTLTKRAVVNVLPSWREN